MALPSKFSETFINCSIIGCEKGPLGAKGTCNETTWFCDCPQGFGGDDDFALWNSCQIQYRARDDIRIIAFICCIISFFTLFAFLVKLGLQWGLLYIPDDLPMEDEFGQASYNILRKSRKTKTGEEKTVTDDEGVGGTGGTGNKTDNEPVTVKEEGEPDDVNSPKFSEVEDETVAVDSGSSPPDSIHNNSNNNNSSRPTSSKISKEGKKDGNNNNNNTKINSRSSLPSTTQITTYNKMDDLLPSPSSTPPFPENENNSNNNNEVIKTLGSSVDLLVNDSLRTDSYSTTSPIHNKSNVSRPTSSTTNPTTTIIDKRLSKSVQPGMMEMNIGEEVADHSQGKRISKTIENPPHEGKTSSSTDNNKHDERQQDAISFEFVVPHTGTNDDNNKILSGKSNNAATDEILRSESKSSKANQTPKRDMKSILGSITPTVSMLPSTFDVNTETVYQVGRKSIALGKEIKTRAAKEITKGVKKIPRPSVQAMMELSPSRPVVVISPDMTYMAMVQDKKRKQLTILLIFIFITFDLFLIAYQLLLFQGFTRATGHFGADLTITIAEIAVFWGLWLLAYLWFGTLPSLAAYGKMYGVNNLLVKHPNLILHLTQGHMIVIALVSALFFCILPQVDPKNRYAYDTTVLVTVVIWTIDYTVVFLGICFVLWKTFDQLDQTLQKRIIADPSGIAVAKDGKTKNPVAKARLTVKIGVALTIFGAPINVLITLLLAFSTSVRQQYGGISQLVIITGSIAAMVVCFIVVYRTNGKKQNNNALNKQRMSRSYKQTSSNRPQSVKINSPPVLAGHSV